MNSFITAFFHEIKRLFFKNALTTKMNTKRKACNIIIIGIFVKKLRHIVKLISRIRQQT